jgi:hypothetical protein
MDAGRQAELVPVHGRGFDQGILVHVEVPGYCTDWLFFSTALPGLIRKNAMRTYRHDLNPELLWYPDAMG